MQEFAYTLGNVVKQARLGQKMTQLEVAERIQADERTILNIEHYKGNPKLEILWPLLQAGNDHQCRKAETGPQRTVHLIYVSMQAKSLLP